MKRVAAVAEDEARVQVEVAAAARGALQDRASDAEGGFGECVRDVLSRREIAARLGVTGQRVSALLGSPTKADRSGV